MATHNNTRDAIATFIKSSGAECVRRSLRSSSGPISRSSTRGPVPSADLPGLGRRRGREERVRTEEEEGEEEEGEEEEGDAEGGRT